MGVVGYLDSGSTSMLAGAVVAGAAGVAVAAKVGWRRVTGVFSGKAKSEPTPEDSAETEPTPSPVEAPES